LFTEPGQGQSEKHNHPAEEVKGLNDIYSPATKLLTHLVASSVPGRAQEVLIMPQDFFGIP
jgi:hypothetical protein